MGRTISEEITYWDFIYEHKAANFFWKVWLLTSTLAICKKKTATHSFSLYISSYELYVNYKT